MDKIKSFSDFLNEAQFNLKNPNSDGETLAGVIKANSDVKEQPKGSNAGNEVNAYLKSVGLKSGLPWCAAFVYYIFDQLSKRTGQTNPLPKTGGVMNHWESAASNIKIPIANARSNHKLIKPGQIFIMSRPGKGLGHTGIVVRVDPVKGTFTAIEGNTNDQQSGEGDRVGINVRRINSKELIGFIDYFKDKRTAEFEKDLTKAVDGKVKALPPMDYTPSDSVVGAGPIGSATDKFADSGKDTSFMGSFLSGLSAFTGRGKQNFTVGEVKDIIDKLR
jgi:hypothetical protein